ncbi:MAG: trypsin-like peptidase domain-containing protein [Phycisphaerales bacterium]|nr:trypsin-like peptidase domain-containing protein [Phycisphaerales bacterium]
MTRPNSRLPLTWWAAAALLVAAIFTGDRIVSRLAYAVERGRIQASSEDLAKLHAELPEVHAVSRAFKLVSNVARPAVVHIAVSGSRATAMNSSQRDARFRYYAELLDTQQRANGAELAPREQIYAWLKEGTDRESNEALDQLLIDALTPRQLQELNDLWEQDDVEQLPPTFRRWFRSPASGSGVVIDAAGYILTNHHVIDGRSEIRVLLWDDREYPAELVGSDEKTDLAVIRIAAEDLHALSFGNSDELEVGDWVLAVGSPFGLQQTVTHGIVSAVGRTRRSMIDIEYQEFIQTDAAINPGNSGGPLLNLRGEVVGINTAIATRGDGVNAGIAFTIPSNRARRIAEQLKNSGQVRRGYLGIVPVPVARADADVFGLTQVRGVIVDRVMRDAPAGAAGLQPDDVILAIDNIPVTGLERFRTLVADLTPGERARFRLLREGQELELTVEMGLQPADLTAGRFNARESGRRVDELGVWARTFRPSLRELYGIGHSDKARGVVVWGLDANGARSSAIEQFDLITECNGQPVRTVGELQEILAAVPRNKEIELVIEEGVGDRKIVVIRGDRR